MATSHGSPVRWESLPFEDQTFDAAILILCIHHFSDSQTALQELHRVIVDGPILIFTYDPEAITDPWLFQYFPDFRTQIQTTFPSLPTLQAHLETHRDFSAIPFPLPADLADNFAGAAWRFPERYLNKDFRNGTSAFRQLDPGKCSQGLNRLKKDLESGAWDSKFGHLRTQAEYPHGYTFVIARRPKKNAAD